MIQIIDFQPEKLSLAAMLRSLPRRAAAWRANNEKRGSGRRNAFFFARSDLAASRFPAGFGAMRPTTNNAVVRT
jgi:hypothetical protein